MAKKNQRRPASRDQLGCMWFVLVITVMLIVSAAGNHNELEKPNKCQDKAAQDTLVSNVGEERNVKITIIKPSVKKLIAEELFNDKELKKQRENAEAGQLSDSELEGRRRKSQRRKNKTRKNSCDNFSHINTTNLEEPQVHRRTKKSHHASERSLDIDNMIEEFYSEIHRRSTSLDTPQEGTDDKACEASSDRIYILKPGFSSPDKAADSHLMRNKLQNERNSSHFFLSEIKRKLKQAIRKEQPGLQRERGFPKNVPTKDHFFLERMAKPSSPQKNNEEDRNQRVSNIYTEAKKHLSEMLNNGDLDSNITSRQVQRTLGRILSLPEYLSPISSPGRRWEKSSTAHRKSASADYINAVNIKKETPVSQPEDAIITSADTQACNLNKEPDNAVESHQPTACEPSEKSVDIEDGTSDEYKISAAGSADDIMITNEIGIVTEEASSTLVSDLSKAEAQDEQTSHEENQPPLASSVASPSHCLAKSEVAITDILEWSSPISVLEPLFIEDDVSPSKMRSQSDEPQVQPWCIHFDDKEDSAAKSREDAVKSITSDKELVFKYVKAVVDAVESEFEELYLKAQFSDQLLEPALISNIPFCPNQLCHDHELLFDCINEVIMELCCCPPWASFVTPRTRVFSTVKSIVHEVQEAVYWHLLPLPLPRALDQIVRKDMAKAGNWLDIRCEIDCFGFETSELILEELLEEVALNCLNNTEHSLVPAELKIDESILVL
ncbi:hypothetical protein Bca52824_061639 [Brassica carinata]|uniref:DUF4378 domain-containing protein n=1 Tax=Brassica carinata TaxID=52824 RepID=A0A8X7R5T7_BRACI|nr:hypothetical protein Bca52824_061639 [Brassica carinata]